MKYFWKREIFLQERNSRISILHCHKGEILGIAGLAGAGRTEFVRALFGADPKDSGQVFIEGKEVQIHSPKMQRKLDSDLSLRIVKKKV